MVIVTKEKPLPENSLDSKLTGDIEDMTDDAKVEVIRCYYRMAVRQTLDYGAILAELGEYVVVLADNPDVAALSEINKKYATAQAYHSRISTIEMQAISNFDAWCSLRKTMTAYILEKSSEYLVEETILNLPNTTIQQAAVRNRLKEAYGFLSRAERSESAAKAFLKIIESKKSDLNAFIANLTRQVKVIALDRETTKH